MVKSSKDTYKRMGNRQFELPSDTKELESFRQNLRALLGETGLGEKASGEVLVAVQEALTNIIRHSYCGTQGKIQIQVENNAEKIKISIRDFGKRFDLTKVPDPKLPR